MDILLVGGTLSHRGGLESFCERARDALVDIGGHRVDWVHSNTAYLKVTSLCQLATCIWMLFRRRKQRWGCLWLQYASLPDLLLLLVSHLFGYRVLVTPHLGSKAFSQSNPLLRSLSVKLLRFAHGIALISTSQAEEIALPPAVPQHLIKTFLPRCFPADLGPAYQQDGKLALVHAGRLSDAKGTFLFLEVCSTLKGLGYDFSAQLIGSCDEATKHRINAFIIQNDLVMNVESIGLLPEGQLLAALSLADALIHLSDIDSFPLIVLEAIGCGAFPICKDLPGARFITQSYCGHLVAGPNAVADVVDVIAGTSPATLRYTAALARQWLLDDYAWSHCVTALETAIMARSDEGQGSRLTAGATDVSPS